MKKFFSGLNPYEMSLIPMMFSLPLLLPSLLFISVPPLDRMFYFYFVASLPLNALCIILYMSAIKHSPLSLTLPYLAFSPVFMIISGFLLLGEIPTTSGLTGIIIVCSGAYILNLQDGINHFFEPVKALANEKGSRIMICVAFLFSIAAPVGKKGILHSSPEFFSVTFFIALPFFLSLCFFRQPSLKRIFSKPYAGAGAGFFFFG